MRKKKSQKKKEVSPKRPLTAFMLFVQKHQSKLSKEEIGRLWRKTPPKKKKQYLTRAQNDRERYRKEMETYVRPKKKKDAKKKKPKEKSNL
jgi:hypothetical protein